MSELGFVLIRAQEQSFVSPQLPRASATQTLLIESPPRQQVLDEVIFEERLD